MTSKIFARSARDRALFTETRAPLGEPFWANDRRASAKAPSETACDWHLDEVHLKIDGRMVYLWRAVDAEGEVLDVLVQSKRKTARRPETDAPSF